MIDLIARRLRSRAATATLFRPLVDGLLQHDPYLVLADFQPYVDCQAQVDARLRATASAGRACRSSTSRASGKFSSDRTIREYARDIWRVPRCRSGC